MTKYYQAEYVWCQRYLQLCFLLKVLKIC